MKTNDFPEEERQILLTLQATGDIPTLKARVARLHEVGWSYRQLAKEVLVSHTTISKWAETEPLGVVALSPRYLSSAGEKTVKWSTHVTDADATRMAHLAPLARKVTAKTPPGSPFDEASAELDELIKASLDRLVPVTEIARITNMTHRAVRARMERRYG